MMCGKVLLCLEGQLCGLQRPLPTYLTSPLDGGQWSCYVRLGTFARLCTVLKLGVQHSMSVRSRPHPFRTHTHTSGTRPGGSVGNTRCRSVLPQLRAPPPPYRTYYYYYLLR